MRQCPTGTLNPRGQSKKQEGKVYREEKQLEQNSSAKSRGQTTPLGARAKGVPLLVAGPAHKALVSFAYLSVCRLKTVLVWRSG